MSKFQLFIFLVLSVIFLNILTPAQTTIFNVPSTDTVSKKSFYVEGDFISHFDSYNNGGFQTYGYRTVYGVTQKFEVGLNLFKTRNGVKNFTEFQPNLKFKTYSNEKYGVAVSTGLLVITPLTRATGNRTIGMFYTNVSKNVKHTNGLRLTGGIYTVVGTNKNFGSKNGAIVGIEQPISGKLSFLGDWYSGKNRFGYTTSGLSYAVTKRQFLFLGYNFGNSGRGNNTLSANYGFTF